MGLVSDISLSLARGASNARRIITGKTANKNFYKGKGSGRMGRWTTKGRFVLEDWRFRQYVVPDLTECQLKPYVSPKVDEPALRKHTVLDYFPLNASNDASLPEGMTMDFVAKCRRTAEIGLR